MSKVIQAGIVTAYGAAVRGGYTGTYDKFCDDLAELANVLSEFLGFRVTIQTLDEGTQATASYNDGVLALGIPRGNTGNGIQRIERINTQGLVKTYRITYTNGTHFDFQVSDGNGIDHTILNADYTLTITYTDGTTWTSGSIRGATGATPNLTIGTVETLLPSQSATATITGTPEDPVLNLGIPKGDTGEVSQAEFDELSGTVTELNRQINKLDNQLSTDSFNILTKDKSAYSENYLGAKFENFVIDGHVTQPQNICITSKSRKTPTIEPFSQLSEDYFSVYLEANKTYTLAMCIFSEYNVPNPVWINVFTLADYTTRTAKIYDVNNTVVQSKEIYTRSITVSTSDYYAIKINFPPYPAGGNYRVCFALYPPKNIYQLIASATALTLSN